MTYDDDIQLPDDVADTVLNSVQLGRALDKSLPTIKKYAADGMPVLKKGSNGQAYEYQLLACYRWMVQRDKTAAARQLESDGSVEQMRLALVGGEDVRGVEAGLPPKEQREVYDAEKAFMMTSLQRGGLVKAEDVVSMLEEVFLIIRDSVTSLPDRLEREAGLNGQQIEMAIGVCDAMLLDAQSCVAVVAGGEHLKAAAE